MLNLDAYFKWFFIYMLARRRRASARQAALSYLVVDVAPLKPSDGTGSPYIVADSHVDCLICFSSQYAAFELV
jgi:hypothetical protein